MPMLARAAIKTRKSRVLVPIFPRSAPDSIYAASLTERHSAFGGNRQMPAVQAKLADTIVPS
ncbi:hypothetical protein D3P04_13795 [Paracoccus onubensis]|uniref:Uncharacterized protein n=1 Tax=Paracoccus onubensis TaxID=1675788 RepID=A0A418SSY2_9RHOB|nr:hypothetical protein D3P04_13795 [Paracoccus onubensis]